MAFDEDESLLGEPGGDNDLGGEFRNGVFKPRRRGLLGRIIYRLKSQRGEVGDLDDDDELPVITGDEDDEPTILKPPVLDDAQALAYLESKTGLKFDSLDQIKNQHSSVSGLTKKNSELLEWRKKLQGDPRYTEILEGAYSGKSVGDSGNELPPELEGLSPNTLKVLTTAVSHLSKKELEQFKGEMRAELRAELFSDKHEGFDEHEEGFANFLTEHEIYGRSKKTLEWAYTQFLKENDNGNEPLPEKPVGGGLPGKKVTRVGISPKPGVRSASPGVKDMGDAETDEDVRAALDAHYNGGGG